MKEVKGSKSRINFDKWKKSVLKKEKRNYYAEYCLEQFDGFLFEAFKEGEKFGRIEDEQRL